MFNDKVEYLLFMSAPREDKQSPMHAIESKRIGRNELMSVFFSFLSYTNACLVWFTALKVPAHDTVFRPMTAKQHIMVGVYSTATLLISWP